MVCPTRVIFLISKNEGVKVNGNRLGTYAVCRVVWGDGGASRLLPDSKWHHPHAPSPVGVKSL